MRVKKVLVCSVPCWNQKTGSDTFSSLLDGYGADCVANLYIRPGVPDSDVCKRYFRITENAIIKSIFNRAIKTGETVDNTSSKTCEDMHNISIVSAQYKGASKKRNYFLLLVREVLWKLGKWKTNELDTFLDEFKPDVVFFAMEGYIHFNRINRYIIKRTGARGVGYFWDDNFSYKQSASLGHRI